jgi:hypothetical protein
MSSVASQRRGKIANQFLKCSPPPGAPSGWLRFLQPNSFQRRRNHIHQQQHSRWHYSIVRRNLGFISFHGDIGNRMMKRLIRGTMLALPMLGGYSFLFFHAAEAFLPRSVSPVHNADNLQSNCFTSIGTAASFLGHCSYGTRIISLRNSLFGRGGDEEQRRSAETNAASAPSSSSSLRAVSVNSSNATVGPVVTNGRSPLVNNSHASSSSSTSTTPPTSLGSSLRDAIMVTREKDDAVKGIGGNGGVVYNVNILKRNLLQE